MRSSRILIATIGLGMVLSPDLLSAHCDSMNGPVINDARIALEKGDVTPVLKWVKIGDEPEIRTVFARTQKVRKQGADAKELADLYFFETLVRIHRAGEGESYTGLKPAETVDESFLAADRAIATGDHSSLAHDLSAAMGKGLRQRLQAVQEAKKHSSESVSAGRAFVRVYVEFIHYVEGLHAQVTGTGVATHGSAEAGTVRH
jgi:hypothetical protein